MSILRMFIIGHLGKDISTNVVNGRTVGNFSVCHSEKYKDSNGVDTTKQTWVEVSYWTDKTAVFQYLKKGVQVYVEGTPSVASYQTNNGGTGVSLRLNCFQVQLLGSSQNSAGNSQPAATQSQSPATGQPDNGQIPDNTPDDLPF